MAFESFERAIDAHIKNIRRKIVPEQGPREVHALANAFNEMAERLQVGAEQRRRLLSDVTQ